MFYLGVNMEKIEDAITLLEYISNHPNGWEWKKLIENHIIPKLKEADCNE
jgi:hypothetical protein